MLATLTMQEYVDWIAYFSVDWSKFHVKQTPEQMKDNLELAFLTAKKKRKRK